MKKLFEKLIAKNTKEDVLEQAKNLWADFVWDWEDEFNSLDEAYHEQGRGAAESQVLNEMIRGTNNEQNLPTDDHCDLFDMLKEHYGLNTD